MFRNLKIEIQNRNRNLKKVDFFLKTNPTFFKDVSNFICDHLRVIWRSFGRHMTVIWGMKCVWKVIKSQTWLLHMKECTKQFSSISWKHILFDANRICFWNFDFMKKNRFRFFFFFTCSRFFEIFILKKIYIKIFEIFSFVFKNFKNVSEISEFQDFSLFRQYAAYRI